MYKNPFVPLLNLEHLVHNVKVALSFWVISTNTFLVFPAGTQSLYLLLHIFLVKLQHCTICHTMFMQVFLEKGRIVPGTLAFLSICKFL